MVTIAMSIAAGFGSMANTQLATNISFTNEKIAREAVAAEKAITATNGNVSEVAKAVQALVSTTIPRPELEYRINANRDALASIDKRIADDVVPRTEFERRLETIGDDIARLKDDTLKRADIESRFLDYKTRLDMISNRVEALQATSAGTAVLQEQVKETQAQIAELRRSLLAAPKFLVHPGESE